MASTTALTKWGKRVQDRETEMKLLYDRQDKDSKLYYKDTYEMTNSYDEKIPEVYNIPMPDARQFCDNIVSNLLMADVIPKIEGEELQDKEASKMEYWFDDVMEVNDEQLKNIGIGGGLHGAHSGQAPMRGWIYTKVYPYMYKGKFFTGIIPWDARYSTYESGRFGLNWMSNRTTRSKDKIEAMYPQIKKLGGLRDSKAEVLDIITADECIIEVAGVEVKSWPHKFGFCPGIVEFNPASAFMRDDDYIEHEGEGILCSVRDLYDALDRVASALMTVTMRAFRYNLMFLSEHPEGSDPDSLEQDPFGEANVFAMKKGERLEAMNIPDLKRSVVYLLNLIETRLQRGTIPATDYGSVSSPMSGLAIKELGEKRNRVLVPCLNTIARMRERIYRMFLKIWNMSKFTHPEIRVPDAAILKKDMKIKVEMQYISPMERIADYTVADAAEPYMDTLDRMKYILKFRDPQQMYGRKQAERMRLYVPQLDMIDGAREFIEQGDKTKAAMVAAQLKMSLSEVEGKGIKKGKVYQADFNKQQQSKSNLVESLNNLGGKVAPGQPSSQEEAAQMAQQQELGGQGG